MAKIYTRFGSPVKIVEAEQVPVWVERQCGEIKWHYKEPKRTKKTLELECIDIWHARCVYEEDGKSVCDGGQLAGHEFRAEGGWAEIVAEFERVRAEKLAAVA